MSQLEEHRGDGLDETRRPAHEADRRRVRRPRDLGQHRRVDPPDPSRPIGRRTACQRVLDLDALETTELGELVGVDDVGRRPP
jgi:hypothetical protein